MRVVVLCSSPYSETGCAMAAHLATAGHAPVGALTLPTLDRGTLIRKIGQWGLKESARYAWTKLASHRTTVAPAVRNPYLKKFLSHRETLLRNLQDVGSAYGFPVAVHSDQNSPAGIAQLSSWAPDAIVFTGGGILRKPLLAVPRIGVVNAHLGFLPQIRGMSTPEWSLLCGIPLGVTIHLLDTGIDTGPILLQRSFSAESDSLVDLRNRMIGFGIELTAEALTGIETGTIVLKQQSDLDRDSQYFVMHDWLRAQALVRLNQHAAATGKFRG
jgi:methionyl-tRNA formyltransferase